MKKIIPVLLLLFYCNAFSQNPSFKAPNYDAIEKEIKDNKSKYYYPVLLERLKTNDSTLTVEEYQHLYYGYVFQKEYKPYSKNPEEDKLDQYLNKAEIDPKDYDEIIKIASKSIEILPFDLRHINLLAYFYHLKGDEKTAKIISIRFHRLLGTILASGNGETCETGFHVTSVHHEYVLLRYFNMKSESQSLNGNCDYLVLEKGKYKKEGIYFNIQKMFDSGFH